MLDGDVKSVVEDVLDAGNGRGAKERLTRDRICEVALEAIDATGLESLSMRTLASALGVKASSLYYYFDSKEELLTGVAEFLYRRLGRPPSTGDWTEQVKSTFVQLRDFIQAHPNAAPLLVRDLAYSPVAKKRANVLLRIVSRAGLDADASASLIGNLVALLVGHTFLEVWLHEGSGSPPEADLTEGQSGLGFVIDQDGSRPWVNRLFPPDDLDSDANRGRVLMGLTGATAQVSQSGTPRERPPSYRGAESQALAGPSRYARSPSDRAFRAGLDALVRGFASD